MTPTNHRKSRDLPGTLCGLGLIGLAAALAITGAVRLENDLLPHVGDIISFDRATTILRNTQARITAMQVGDVSGRPCVLDASAMWASGGSLLIDAAQFEPRLGFRVHWAGGRTSNGAADCGAAAELLLSSTDISVLMFAVGGSSTPLSRR